METKPRSLPGLLPLVVGTFATYALAGGVLSLLGWVLDVPRLTDWVGDGISIQPNTAVAVMVSGAALLALVAGARRTASALGLVVTAIGASVLFQYAARVDLGIDTLLMFDRRWGHATTSVPGRMGAPAATSWTLVGIATLLAARPSGARGRRIVPVLAILTASISLLSLIGYLYRASPLYEIPVVTAIARQTATFIFGISIALVLTIPELGPTRLLNDRGPAGMFLRRLVPVVVLGPILIGYLRLAGERAGFYDALSGSALRTLTEIVLFLLLIWWTGAALARHSRHRSHALTKQARLEAERHKQEQLLRSVAEHARVGLVIVDERHCYLYANPSYVEVHGLGGQDLVGRRISEVLGATYDEQFKPRLDRAFRGERVQDELILPARGADASERCVTVSCEPHRSGDGRILSVVVSVIDLTQRKEIERTRDQALERERAARSEAERALRVKDEFLATLSHELRTPLNAVIGWSQFLRRDATDPARVRTSAEVIERNGWLQAQLITDLLDLSRIESGKMRLDVQRVDLPTTVDSAIESILPAADAKAIRLERVIEPLVDSVQGDPGRLHQIVWNLLSNAVKFTPRGGRVQVALACVGSHVELRVSDTGEGMSPEFLPHVFERFRQADASPSRTHGGLGIGLALVKQLVELHGGRVRATSEGPGKGSTFVVELPLAAVNEREHGEDRGYPQSPRSPMDRDRAAAVRLPGVKALLVDDEPDALEMVRRLLEESGARVTTAASSDEALALLARESFDVIVCDIGMPERDGYALISDVRARGLTTPALALTAFARTEDRTRALLSGYQAHVSKPVQTAELLATIGALLPRASSAAAAGAGA